LPRPCICRHVVGVCYLAAPDKTMSSPTVSVVVPVYRHPAELRACLGALERQTYPDAYEVIVVDNGGNGDLSDLVRAHAHATLTAESAEGSYAARNRGLAQARAPLLAFTDADCIPAPDWLARGVARLRESPQYGIVGGGIRIFFRNPTRPSAVELFSSVVYLQQEVTVLQKHYAVTANLFTRRSVFDQVGPFDAQRRSGGDRDFGLRVASVGMMVLYAPEARVDHPALDSLGALVGKARRLAGNEFAELCRRPHPWRAFLTDLAKNVPVSPLIGLRIARRNPRVHGWQRTLEFCMLWFLCRNVRQYEFLRLHCGGAARR
jgi:cellulose synthase/poly-beta-1,6-N-acetylglucosamine synthase-like glycosyltransferase